MAGLQLSQYVDTLIEKRVTLDDLQKGYCKARDLVRWTKMAEMEAKRILGAAKDQLGTGADQHDDGNNSEE
jgi:hypothetical protein